MGYRRPLLWSALAALSVAHAGPAVAQGLDRFAAALAACAGRPEVVGEHLAILGATPLAQAELDQLRSDYVRDIAAGVFRGADAAVPPPRIEDHTAALLVFGGWSLASGDGDVRVTTTAAPDGSAQRCEVDVPGDRLTQARRVMAVSRGEPATEVSVANGTMLVWPTLMGAGAEEFVLVVTLPGRAYTVVRMYAY